MAIFTAWAKKDAYGTVRGFHTRLMMDDALSWLQCTCVEHVDNMTQKAL